MFALLTFKAISVVLGCAKRPPSGGPADGGVEGGGGGGGGLGGLTEGGMVLITFYPSGMEELSGQ